MPLLVQLSYNKSRQMSLPDFLLERQIWWEVWGNCLRAWLSPGIPTVANGLVSQQETLTHTHILIENRTTTPHVQLYILVVNIMRKTGTQNTAR